MNTVTDFISPEYDRFSSAVNSFLPSLVTIPFNQDDNRACAPCIEPGETVREGQVIARSLSADSGKESPNIHASIPGTVIDLIHCQFPDGRQGMAAKIALAGSFTFLGKKKSSIDWHSYSADELKRIFIEKGIVNTFDGSRPLLFQTSKSAQEKKQFVIIRLFDEDPSRTSDSFIAVHSMEQVIAGAFIIAHTVEAKGVIVVFDKAHPVSQKVVSDNSAEMIPSSFVEIDAQRYPSGFRKELLAAIKKNNVSAPFNECSIHDLFIDPPTALSVYEAVVCAMPVISRFVHITGDCLRASALMNVRIGTSLRDLVEQCGGFRKKPVKIVINGLVTGCSVSSLDIPVTKQVKSVAFLPEKDVPDQRYITCVRCGECRRICPAKIMPDILHRAFSTNDTNNVYVPTALLCTGCSLCNAVCPARLPLSQTIALLKKDAENVYEK